ncbi:MAG: ComEC family competence protein [Bacteroidales bacterium]|nr:ComEC family competence protein [Bacteroidales bacterium]
MMIAWFKYPFIRILLPFIIGVVVGFSTDNLYLSKNNVLLLLIIITFLLTSLILSSCFIKSYRYRWVFFTLFNIFFLVLSFTLVKIQDYKLKINGLENIDCVPKYYVARLEECPTIKDKSVKVNLELLGIVGLNDNFISIKPKIISYFEKDEKSFSLKYGDYIAFLVNPKEIEKPPNPEQFDYKDYMYKKGVAYQVYLKSDEWLNLDYNRTNKIYELSYRIRDFLLETMQRLGINGDEYAVASAILLGYDDSLPLDLRQQYVAAGAMHILCVSGLHVGVVFMVFSYILMFLNDRKRIQSVVKQLLLLLLVWFYALLAGLAPSILRSTIMISFVIIGNIINRKGVLLNSLAASAFILLCFKPSNLFDVGFLLSYLAVVGIVVLQKPISKMFYSKYKIVNKIWEITSVTIAAQIATTPFSIYYFHQFPVYFWLSNLFMTPISSVVIIGGMIMLLIFFLPFVNELVAFCVSKMISIMNYGIAWIESLPHSIIKGIYIDDVQFVILLIILLMILLVVDLREKKLIIPVMILVSFFLMINVKNIMNNNKQKEMVIYSLNNMTAVDFICGREHLLLADSIFFSDNSSFSYNIENYLVKKGTFQNEKTRCLNEDFDDDFVKKRKSVVTFDKKVIAMCEKSNFYRDTLNYRIPVDYMLIYGRNRKSLKQLLKVYDFDYLIIDGSVPYYLLPELIAEADDLGIKYHSIKDNGAFILK